MKITQPLQLSPDSASISASARRHSNPSIGRRSGAEMQWRLCDVLQHSPAANDSSQISRCVTNLTGKMRSTAPHWPLPRPLAAVSCYSTRHLACSSILMESATLGFFFFFFSRVVSTPSSSSSVGSWISSINTMSPKTIRHPLPMRADMPVADPLIISMSATIMSRRMSMVIWRLLLFLARCPSLQQWLHFTGLIPPTHPSQICPPSPSLSLNAHPDASLQVLHLTEERLPPHAWAASRRSGPSLQPPALRSAVALHHGHIVVCPCRGQKMDRADHGVPGAGAGFTLAPSTRIREAAGAKADHGR